MLCTMQGDVWHVEGLDATLGQVRWRRFASGLHQALGLVVADGLVHVLGRDQITRLHDLNGDGEADYYECVSNAYETSPAGHDFISGLQRDAAGNFYTVSGKQGLLKIATRRQAGRGPGHGFRNPDGLGLSSSGVLTVPNSEGEWVPASMICEVRPGGSLRLWRAAQRPPSGPTARLPAAGAGQLERRTGGSDLRPLGTAQGSVDSLLIRSGSPFLGPARPGRWAAPGGRRPLGR